VADFILHLFATVARDNHELGDARFHQSVELMDDHRFSAHLNECLGKFAGDLPKPAPAARSEDDRLAHATVAEVLIRIERHKSSRPSEARTSNAGPPVAAIA